MLPFTSAVGRWFDASFETPTRAQELAWPAIAARHNVFPVAPTGSGKTLAAFLALLDRLIPEPRAQAGLHVLYASPPKPPTNDIHSNFDVPLRRSVEALEQTGQYPRG